MTRAIRFIPRTGRLANPAFAPAVLAPAILVALWALFGAPALAAADPPSTATVVFIEGNEDAPSTGTVVFIDDEDSPTTDAAHAAIPAKDTATTGVALSTQGAQDAAASEVPAADRQTTGREIPEAQTVEARPDLDDKEGLRLNFRGVPLDTVLEYLSKAAGFIIVRNVDVAGTVDVYSHQPLSKDEAVALLDTVLNEKGYAAIRNDRLLLIVDRDDAVKRNIPVRSGRDPERIPKTDEMVTQIIPVSYANAVQLLENLRPLLPSYAVATANESSNAIVLTDTQTNVRRIAEIVKALDTSISGISTLRVILLRYADAAATADLVNRLFENDSSGTNAALNRIRRNSRRGGFGFPFGGPMGGDSSDNSGQTGSSPAREAASRVLAVADERMNAVVISAPEEAIPAIEDLVRQIDVDTEAITEVRVFTLHYANAEETAKIISDTFQSSTQSSQTSNNSRGNRRNWASFFGGGQQPSATSQRQTTENTVVAVADTRTNSVVVTAGSDMMRQIEQVIARLDANPAKSQEVRVYNVRNANPEDVAAILQQMFQKQGAGSTTSTGSTGRSSQSSQSNRSNRSNQSDGTNRSNSSTSQR